MSGMNQGKLLVFILLASFGLFGQQPASSTGQSPNQSAKKAPATTVAASETELDLQTLIKETEYLDMRRHKIGIFWWVPPDYWESALHRQAVDSEQVRKAFQPFKNYNLFVIAVGDLEASEISWFQEAEVKKNVILRDQHGNKYKPVEETPDELAKLIQLMRPVFKNMMGNFGGGIQFVLFPMKDSTGNVFADPRKSSEIFLDVSDLMGTGTSTYAWRFPLTALSPPKYCFLGKEKVEANWKFCPWHGNRLDDEVGAASHASPSKP